MLQTLLASGRRLVRSARRTVKKILTDLPQIDADLTGFRGELRLVHVPDLVKIASAALFRVHVRNTGTETWPTTGYQSVSLGYHWRLPVQAGYLVRDDGHRSPLPHALAPGHEATVLCAVMTPATTGQFELELDLFRNLAGWFGNPQATDARRLVSVDGLRGDDFDTRFDYHQAYRQVDLDENFWKVVGPATLEEFQLLGQSRMQELILLGLNPRSRVLDVGCGTGALANPLLDYLAADGVYVGTDLAAEAVGFCRKKYARSNFRFLQNDMTHLPLRDETFDVIFLASVFTHMFPHEIAGMLAELRRLLAPGGFILADAFHSPEVSDHTPSRGLVEINEEILFEVFRDSGMHFDIHFSSRFNSRTLRTIFKFTHAKTSPVYV